MTRRALAAAALALASVAAAPAPGRALEGRIDGTIVNGTRGGPGRADAIQLLRHEGGMETVAEVENVESTFTLPSVVGESGERFLLRATHDGVSYSRSFAFSETGVNVIEIAVYDTTSAATGVHVARYQVGLAAEPEVLRVFKVFEVTTGGTPPRTVVGRPGAFRFRVQAGLLRVRSASAQYGTIPINQDPIPLEGEGGYAIDFPLRPGVTEIHVAYDLPYREVGTLFSEALLYPVSEMNVLIVPTSLEVTSELLADRGIDEHDGIRVFSGRDLPAQTPIVFRLAGEGSARADEEHASEEGRQSGDGTKVVRVPNRTSRLILPALAGILGPLAAALAFSLARRPARAGAGARRAAAPALLAAREAILDRIVSLDRRYRAAEISEYAYWQKREALKGELVELIERIERGEAGA